MDVEKLDRLQFQHEIENYANQILNAPCVVTRGDLEASKDFCERSIAELDRWLGVAQTEDEKLEIRIKTLRYRRQLSNTEDALHKLSCEPAAKPIDRAGLSAAWEKLPDVDRRIGVCLELKGIKDDTYRKWKHGKLKDASPSASRIVEVLADDLRAAGVDVSRFGVAVDKIVPVSSHTAAKLSRK